MRHDAKASGAGNERSIDYYRSGRFHVKLLTPPDPPTYDIGMVMVA